MCPFLRSVFVPAVAIVVMGLPGSAVLAKAPPRSADVMQPIDTSAGSISDPKHLLQIDMDKFVSVSVSGQPAEVAYNQISALLGIEWGFAPGIDQTKPVSLSVSGPSRDVIKALGNAAGVRFEANGPLQIRVVRARAPVARKRTVPPPSHHP